MPIDLDTADFLNDAISQRNALAANLTAKGVTAQNTEKYNTLVSKVLNIDRNEFMQTGQVTFTEETPIFSIELNHPCKQFTMFCLDSRLHLSTTYSVFGILQIDASVDSTYKQIFQMRSPQNAALVGWTVGINYEIVGNTLNLDYNSLSYAFAKGCTYTWIALTEG